MRRRATVVLGVAALTAAGLGIARPTHALAATSSSVGYLSDTSSGGFSLWIDAFHILAVPDGGSYTTVSPAPGAPQSMTIHNVSMTALDVPSSTALSGMDTLVMFAVCDIGNHPNAMKAINTFLDAGNKIIILDGAQCTDTQGGNANYSTFEKPFTSTYKDPVPQQQPSGPYTAVEASALTSGMPDCGPSPCNEPGNSLSDASVLSATSTGWCQAIAGTSLNGVSGPVMAYTHNTAGTGLVVYEGEAFAWSTGATNTDPTAKHLRLLFDDMVSKAWNSDGLPCGTPVGSPPPIAETHLAVLVPLIGLGVLGGGLMVAQVRRRRGPATA